MKCALRKFAAFVVLVLSLTGLLSNARAEAHFFTEAEMIEKAEVIAIVDIWHVDKSDIGSPVTKTKRWGYTEIAHATVHQTLKGNLRGYVKLFGGETFICAQVNFSPGRYLVFLIHDSRLLVGCNWHLSVRPIKDKEIEWCIPDNHMQLSWQPLDQVLERIKKQLPSKEFAPK